MKHSSLYIWNCLLGNAPDWRRAALGGMVLLALGCATPVPPASEQSSPSPSAPVLKGKEIGRQFMLAALSRYRFRTEYAVAEPVRRIGRKVAAAAGANPDSFHFVVVHNPQANAFAIPGGYIFVFDGLLARLRREEELAGVLAHEVGHVSQAHFFKDQKKIVAADLATIAAILLGQVGEAVTAFSLAGSQSLQLSFSRENEREADRVALGYLTRAGYDPTGLIDFFDTLSRQERLVLPQSNYPYLSTHPGLSERAVRTRWMIERAGAAPVPPKDPDRWSYLSGVLAGDTVDLRKADGTALARGMALLTAGRLDSALMAFEAAVAARPESLLRQVGMVRCLLAMGRFEQAQHHASKALALGPDDAEALFWSAEALRLGGDDAGALAAFRHTVTLAPGHPMAHFRLHQLLEASSPGPKSRFHLARYLRLTLRSYQAEAVFAELAPGEDGVPPEGVGPALAEVVKMELQSLHLHGI